jgi:ferredoxin-NADP reductase
MADIKFPPPPLPTEPAEALPAAGTDAPAIETVPIAVLVSPATPAAPVRQVRTMDAVCVDVVRRTHDTATLFFSARDPGTYLAGQFISIDPHQFLELQPFIAFLEKLKDRTELVRSYSMSSIPSEKFISITVKSHEYDAALQKYPPLLSPLLASGALKGRACVISGFAGSYTVPADIADQTDQVLHLVCGSGIVPNYAILKAELTRTDRTSIKHTMIDVNKTVGDIIFHDELAALAKAYPTRFEYINLVTREDATHLGPTYFTGRPTTELVKRYVRDLSTVRVYACGAAATRWQRAEAREKGIASTPRFMEGVEAILQHLGVPKKHIKTEVFG